MYEAIFSYNGQITIIQCKKEEYIKDICKRYSIKIDTDINKLFFLYGGLKLDKELTFNEVIKQEDKSRNKMNILVTEIDDDNNSKDLNLNEKIIKSKDIICPKCGEICIINIDDYKLILNECMNGHECILSLDEYDKTQNINESKINCEKCRDNNKAISFGNKFFKCNKCGNLCPLCKSLHEKDNKDHILIDYDRIHYICINHNKEFSSYCKKCKRNLCMQCLMSHNNHGDENQIITYMEIMPNIKNVKEGMEKLKNVIDKFNNNIKEMIEELTKKINIIKRIIDENYEINKNILDNFNAQNINYELFKSINNINNNNNAIINELNNFVNENNIENKVKKILNLHNKMMSEKVIFTYSLMTKNKKILDIKDGESAGEIGQPIIRIAIKASSGKVRYRVHILNGNWLPYVSGFDLNDNKGGYAGNDSPIDCIQVKHNSIMTKYRVSPLNSEFFSYQLGAETSNGMDGYSGKIGKEIDRFELTQNN